MKIQIKQILSLSQNQASCSILIFDKSIKILLDCGINPSFNFQLYQKFKDDFKDIQFVLISHSALQYSGAFLFLVQQFNMNPSIFYTTQPIMRHAPLNFHQKMINFRFPNYDKKVFNKIYSIYEELQLVKPYQKITIQIQNNQQIQKVISNQEEVKAITPQNLLRSSSKSIIFSCSMGGGSLGSIAWRINFGLLNTVYLVQYSNFSLHHLNGLDLQYLKQKPIDILITDFYKPQEQTKMTKNYLYQQLKDVFDSYNQNFPNPYNMPLGYGIPPPNQKKLLITCYPNQVLIQVMHIMKKIVSDFHQGLSRQKIKVIHLSSRYIQLVKSQIQYFSDDLKTSLDKIDQFFVHSTKILPRINVAPIGALNNLLNQQLKNDADNIIIYHVGQKPPQDFSNFIPCEKAHDFLKKLNTINQQSKQIILDKKQSNFAIQYEIKQKTEINQQISSIMNLQEQQQSKQLNQKEFSQAISMQQQRKNNQYDILQNQNQIKLKTIHGRYISHLGFPHFARQKKQSNDQFDDYGLKFKYQDGNRLKARQINANIDDDQYFPMTNNLQKKTSKVQVLNMEFDVSKEFFSYQINSLNFKFLGRKLTNTNKQSSIRVLNILKPKNIVFINGSSKFNMIQQYKKGLEQLSPINSKIYDLFSKKKIYIEQQNQLMEYKINISQSSNLTIQKVKGRIQYTHGAIHIHLQPSGQKQIMQFRLQQFFKRVKSRVNRCQFIGKGLIIDGIKLLRAGNEIILQGQYSQEYFKVRQMLYEFLKIR